MITFKRVLLGLFAILALGLLATFLFAKDFSVEVSETQAQTLFDKEIASGPFQKYGIKLSVNEAKIDFRDDNTMRLDADLTSDALGYKSVIKGQFTSGVRYSVPRIYLNDLKPIELDIDTSKDEKDELSEIKSAAQKFLERQRENTQNEKAKEHLNNILGETDEDFEKTLAKATYRFFESIPIYDLRLAGYKGSLASLALKDIEFREDHAVITLSPSLAVVRILIGIGTALLTILFVLAELRLLHLLLPKSRREKEVSDYIEDNPTSKNQGKSRRYTKRKPPQ